jgi:methylated-DNA-[protein]-cysteine S-methyltransferase
MGVSLSVFPSGWGWIGMAMSERGLAGLTLPLATEEAAWSRLRAGWPDGAPSTSDRATELRLRLLDYLAGTPVDFSDVPLDLPVRPPFWRRVWEACARIPYGETRSYAELARELGAPGAFRAVGGAMAANPIPLVIPCHRVLGSNGSLVGFGGGLDQKRRMLQMEAGTTR